MANISPGCPAQSFRPIGIASWALGILLDCGLIICALPGAPALRPCELARGFARPVGGRAGSGRLPKQAFLIFVSTYISTSNLVYGSGAAVIALLTLGLPERLDHPLCAYLSVLTTS